MTDQEIKEESLPEVSDVKTKELTLTGGIIPKDFDELTRFASLVQKSGLAPKGFDSVEKVAIGMLTNMELGRPIITGLQDLAIINGRCGIYGDASLAMVTASGLMDEDYPKSEETGTPYTDDWTFKYTVKRIGRPPETGTWSWLDSKKAGFDAPKTRDGKEDRWSPWTRFTKRMMQWKARNFVMRDNFGDVLKGMKTVEDLHDLDPIPLKRQPNGSYSDEVAPGASDLTDKIKEREKVSTVVDAEPDAVPCPYCQANIRLVVKQLSESAMSRFNCPACEKEGMIEDGKPIGIYPPDHTARNSEGFKDQVEEKPEKPKKKVPSKKRAQEKTPEPEENQKRDKLKTDAYDSLSNELSQMPQDVVMKAKKDIGLNKIIGTLTLEELEALVKKCKELQKAVVDNQRVAMIDEIEGNYKPNEISSALVKIERASLSGCSLSELGVIYDDLRKGEGEGDLA